MTLLFSDLVLNVRVFVQRLASTTFHLWLTDLETCFGNLLYRIIDILGYHSQKIESSTVIIAVRMILIEQHLSKLKDLQPCTECSQSQRKDGFLHVDDGFMLKYAAKGKSPRVCTDLKSPFSQVSCQILH